MDTEGATKVLANSLRLGSLMELVLAWDGGGRRKWASGEREVGGEGRRGGFRGGLRRRLDGGWGRRGIRGARLLGLGGGSDRIAWNGIW